MKRFNVYNAENMYLGYVIAKDHEKAMKAAKKAYPTTDSVVLSNLSYRQSIVI